ncbi:uncharacterized protein LOC113351709 [Papaver somniferum]|uniref:uncharacterized protein LOC113351709 n=1 Tax=Papaver somniferum TaxID=3469 RepID=UPI000E6FCDEB|nr:uncharacterized protein LOC113351709 [Papaver somniferum]
MWMLTRNGVFSVKSSYRKLVELKNVNSTFDEEASKLWKKLWDIPTLPKFKHFLWKCMIDVMPSNERMARVMGYTGDQYKMCQNGTEITKHILWECSFSREVWTTRPGERRSMMNPDTSVQEWIKSWFNSEFSQIEDDWIVKMANTTWEIWKECCKCVFDNARPNPVGVIKSIELLNATTGQKMVHKHQTEVYVIDSGTSVTKWMPPSSPYYSICCDASFKSVNNVEHSGWGLICRDFAGQFIRDECIYANGIVNAEEAECKGLIQAMQVAENIELQMVCFELDAKLVIKAVNGDIQVVAWQNQVLIFRDKVFFRKTSFMGLQIFK